jgi:hypothetical protein
LHEIVPVLTAVDARFPLRGRRWVIEHIGRSRESDIDALARLGVLVTTMPTCYLWKGGEKYFHEPEGGNLMLPHQRLLDAGVPLAIATDNIPYDPFFTLWVSCAREERRSGHVIDPEQRLTAEEALRLFTVNGSSPHFRRRLEGTAKTRLRRGSCHPLERSDHAACCRTSELAMPYDYSRRTNRQRSIEYVFDLIRAG